MRAARNCHPETIFDMLKPSFGYLPPGGKFVPANQSDRPDSLATRFAQIYNISFHIYDCAGRSFIRAQQVTISKCQQPT
jgi:hypothetical protein